jgi:CDP-6-deoxy-D-xylo-4-hexulose-3-dehydrase
MDAIVDFAKDNDLFLIEDACDALGSKYGGKYLGTFGDFATFSFYPAHHITTGEGGMVVTNNDNLARIAQSLRDWGRACVMPYCNPLNCGDKECPKANPEASTFFGELPNDYDKRYTYTQIGYNLKPIEMQGAMGIVQLRKLPNFIKARKKNFQVLYEEFQRYEDYFILPESVDRADPCWFAFPLTVKKSAPFSRRDIVHWFTKHNIEVKMIFSGNILKHPAYKVIRCRIVGDLKNTDYVMYNSFFVGVYPGLDEKKVEFMLDVLGRFILNT